MKIYLARNNIQAGPYTLDELNSMLASGEVLLDDLAWHSGMSDWQRLGDLTDNQTFYQPKTSSTPSPAKRGFGDNVEFYPPNQQPNNIPRRVSVDELYGRPASADSQQPSVVLIKDTPTTLVYASILSRFVAFVINLALYLMALLPALIAFTQVVDVNQLAGFTDYASIQAYAETLAKQVNPTTIATSNIMLFALFAIQLLLIMMRGQSFGKLVMGIRVLDQTTHKLPSLGKLVLMRTLLLITIYFIALSFLSGIPAIVLLATHYFLASGNPHKQGWHDKMTKTIVAKAHPTQLDKTKS